MERMDRDKEIREMKKKINLQLLLSIIVTISLGHLIPMDFKVVYGFCAGIGVGVFLFPRLLEARIRDDINKMWRRSNDNEWKIWITDHHDGSKEIKDV